MSTKVVTRQISSSANRRIAVAAIIAGLVFLVLWVYLAFAVMNAALIGAVTGGVVFMAGLVSQTIEEILDLIASLSFAAFAMFGALFAGLLGAYAS